jgi:hypothetical protein
VKITLENSENFSPTFGKGMSQKKSFEPSFLQEKLEKGKQLSKSAAELDSTWEFFKEDKGITVRSMKYGCHNQLQIHKKNTQPIVSICGRGTIKASSKTVLALLSDISRCSEWDPLFKYHLFKFTN